MKDSLSLYKRLVPFLLPYWKWFVLAGLCALPLSLCSAGLAYLMKPAIDDVFLNKDVQMLKLLPLGIVLLYTVKGTFEFGYNFILGFKEEFRQK